MAIGTSTAPSYPLDVVGTIQVTGLKMTTGAGADKVLSSDASGLASWQTSVSSASVSSVFGRTGAVTAVSGDYSVGNITGAAPLASPTFTGTVTIPTLSVTGAITGATIDTGYGAKEIGDSVGNCAAADVHKGDGACKAESSLSVSYATTAGSAPKGTLTCTTVNNYSTTYSCDTKCAGTSSACVTAVHGSYPIKCNDTAAYNDAWCTCCKI